MQRKVVRQGPNTLMVSLPIKWAKNAGIKKGDAVNIIEKESSLLITKGEVEEEMSRISVEIREDYTISLIRAIISNLYKKGYDLIEVSISDDKAIGKVKRAVNTLMGLEIVDQKKGKLVLQNISVGLDKELDNYLRKSFFLALETLRITREDYSNNNYTNLEQIQEMNANIKKFTDVCKRAINKRGAEKNELLYLVVWCLEKTANEYMYMYSRCSEKRLKAEKETLAFLDETNAYFKRFYEAFYSIRKLDLDYFSKTKDLLYYKKSYELLEKTKQPVVVMHIANVVRMTLNMVNPLIGVRYD